MRKYIPKEIEKKWQKSWEDSELYASDDESSVKEKMYILDMFPYPSGHGMHVGHPKGYIATDIIARFYRLAGRNVLHPMGWDAFGLNAENYAIRNKMHPRVIVQQSIDNMKRQMQMIALSYDWSREINTTDPEYYKWTQWIFLKLFERGLAYEMNAPINWCPKDKTGLANEEVIGGVCERCGTKVERKMLRQWVLKITEYADRLAEDVQSLDWPQPIKDMQINWIGRSEGSLIRFDVESKDFDIEVFTTRADTLFGVTALVVAPEYSKLDQLVTNEMRSKVDEYLEGVKSKSDLERTELNKDKTGIFTGSFAINPANGERVPIWVADYVLGFYGTGAVMFVPAHDERDFEFAKKFNLEIKQVIQAKSGENIDPATESSALFTGYTGVLINSSQFNGMTTNEAKKAINEWLSEKDKASFKVQYKLRDWLFSRQRYWGEPIPIIHCEKCGLVPVPESELPVELPNVENYEPTGTGESPLAAIEDWVNVDCPKCGGKGKRETNTMPQWAGSCWYYLRFCDPKNSNALISKDAEKYWLPVDFYVGGAEHAVLHLLYARFWHKVLFDIGVVKDPEPFLKLRNVGLIMAEDGTKMSKSVGNVITPDEVVEEYGADCFRVYECFIGPFEATASWDTKSINGVYRFLQRFWEVILKDSADLLDSEAEAALNKLILKVESDVKEMKFNTAVAAFMEFINLVFHKQLTADQKKRALIVLAPFAPHITEELWEMIGEKYSVHQQSWPEVDEKYLTDEQVKVAVQVDGKVREILLISSDMVGDSKMVEKMALESEKVTKFLNGLPPQRVIYVPGKVLSLISASS